MSVLTQVKMDPIQFNILLTPSLIISSKSHCMINVQGMLFKMVCRIILGEASPIPADLYGFIDAPYNLRDPMLIQITYNETRFYGFNSFRIAGATLKLSYSLATPKVRLQTYVFPANVAHVSVARYDVLI